MKRRRWKRILDVVRSAERWPFACSLLEQLEAQAARDIEAIENARFVEWTAEHEARRQLVKEHPELLIQYSPLLEMGDRLIKRRESLEAMFKAHGL